MRQPAELFPGGSIPSLGFGNRDPGGQPVVALAFRVGLNGRSTDVGASWLQTVARSCGSNLRVAPRSLLLPTVNYMFTICHLLADDNHDPG